MHCKVNRIQASDNSAVARFDSHAQNCRLIEDMLKWRQSKLKVSIVHINSEF